MTVHIQPQLDLSSLQYDILHLFCSCSVLLCLVQMLKVDWSTNLGLVLTLPLGCGINTRTNSPTIHCRRHDLSTRHARRRAQDARLVQLASPRVAMTALTFGASVSADSSDGGSQTADSRRVDFKN